MFETLKLLCELPGPGGREERVHNLLAQRWKAHSEWTKITPVGNLIVHIGGQGPRLLLVGHGDEIGFAVKYISPEGFIYFTTGQREASGRPDLRGMYFTPMGQPALVIGREALVPGVFATLTGHILSVDQRAKTALDWNDLFVDVFMGSRREVEAAGLHIGDRVIWNPPTRQSGKFYYGKAMDNRVALAVMDALLDRLDTSRLQFDLYLGSTVMEESGLYGAESINDEIKCELAIAVDTGLSGDVPGVDPRDVSTRLGGGPILIHKDLYGYNFNLNNRLIDTAHAASIPLQHAVHGIYGTDAGMLVRRGAAASAIGVPTRYTHSPLETVHADDLDSTLNLLLAFLYGNKV
ncbi:MAG: M42 family metallopeptidase [Aggregatilineales bacterium]